VSRLSQLNRSDVDPSAHATWDELAGSRGTVRGPFQVLMRVPELCEKIAATGTYLRYRGLLGEADRELAIVAVGYACDAPYECAVHEPVAHQVGVRTEALDVLATDASTASLLPRERVIIDVARALARDYRLSDDLFDRALLTLGEKILVELVGRIGFYIMQAVILGAFGVETP
jgi:4-carboxymuconolactone decarboxylase